MYVPWYSKFVTFSVPPPCSLKVAPSILGAAVCEAVAFMVGALTDIPALRQFCLVAATAVLVGFVLQVSHSYNNWCCWYIYLVVGLSTKM